MLTNDEPTLYYVVLECRGFVVSRDFCRCCDRRPCTLADQDACPNVIDAGTDFLLGPYVSEGQAQRAQDVASRLLAGTLAQAAVSDTIISHYALRKSETTPRTNLRVVGVTPTIARAHRLHWPPPLHWTTEVPIGHDDSCERRPPRHSALIPHRAAIAEGRAQGIPYRVLAEMYECTPSTMRKFCAVEGIQWGDV